MSRRTGKEELHIPLMSLGDRKGTLKTQAYKEFPRAVKFQNLSYEVIIKCGLKSPGSSGFLMTSCVNVDKLLNS